MTDKELIDNVMNLKIWKRVDVARYLRVDPAKITRVMQEKENLHGSSRKLLEMLYEDLTQQKITMTDKELLWELMGKNDWNQTQLAENLGITQGQISRVINEKQALRPALRKLAEKLLEEAE